jgi:hypothetical protein
MKNRVLASIENDHGDRCVDIFVRPDETYGFEEFRRDPEDCGQWRCLNRFSQHVFTSEPLALASARDCVQWLPRIVSRHSG